MPIYSVIENNKIVNTVVADSLEDAIKLTNTECKEQNDSFPYGIGFEFNGIDWLIPSTETEETSA